MGIYPMAGAERVRVVAQATRTAVPSQFPLSAHSVPTQFPLVIHVLFEESQNMLSRFKLLNARDPRITSGN